MICIFIHYLYSVYFVLDFDVLIFYSLFAMISCSIAHFHFLLLMSSEDHLCDQLRLIQLRAKHKSFHLEAWLLADLGAS